jgi:hypothetical protein
MLNIVSVVSKGRQNEKKKDDKQFHKRDKPAQRRYVADNRAFTNKRRRAQRYANKFHCTVLIKNKKYNEIVEVKPVI